MSDAVTLLEQDHRKVEALFERYRDGNRRVTGEICDELEVHTAIEERVVYPLLGSLSGGEDLEREALEEHGQVEEAVARVRQLPEGSDEAAMLMEAIVAAVTHHVEEEEREILPRLSSGLGMERLREIGERLLEAKRVELASKGALARLTKDQLYEMAQATDLHGRSDMTKKQLVDALSS